MEVIRAVEDFSYYYHMAHKASILQLHPDCTLIVDEKAASLL